MRIRTLTGAALLALAGTAVFTQPASAAGTAYHLDCATGNDANTGTAPGAAWKTLGKVNGRTFGAGDQILILRGTTCTGALTPKGSGATGSPVTVDAYGTGAKPVIAGAGAEAAVRLYNQQWWEIRNLEITNRGATVGRRRGVSVELADYGTASHLVLENLDIHDVNGEDKKDLGGSGGIYLTVSGTTTQTLFDGITIRNNTVNKVDRVGIFMVSTWNRSGFEANPAGIFRPWPNVVISGNRLGDLGGDGIVAGNTTGALIERNYVNGFQKRSAGYNAGMWAYDADYAVFQYNEATGGQTTRDGMAYDVDQGTIGTVFQYNHSHDNAGGFMLLCNASGIVRDAVVRYNISQNDAHRGVETCSAGGIESADVYNNTIFVGPGVSQTVVNDNNTTRRNVRFRNNVVVKTGSGAASFSSLGTGYVLDHNVLVNVTGAPAGAGSTADPRLSGAGTATDLDHADGYRLCADSPAIGTGALIGANGGRDYYGNPVSGTAAPNVGAHGGPGVTCSAGPVTSGGTYEVALSGTGQALDVPGGATAPGTRLILWARHGGDNQRWTFTANGDGSYAIRNVRSGLCVDVDGASATAGAAILQWTCTGTANQRWQVSPAAGGGYTVTARHSGLVLGAVATGNGSAVTQQAGTGAATQRWAFTAA